MTLQDDKQLFLKGISIDMGDNRFNDDIQSDSPQSLIRDHLKPNSMSLNNIYNYEKNRLATFQNWPAEAPVSADRIARAGFFYTGERFTVQCFSCQGKISEWDYGDQVSQKHADLNPRCPFINHGDDNVPLIPHEIRNSHSLQSLGSGSSTGTSDRLDNNAYICRGGNNNGEYVPSTAEEKTWDSFRSLVSEAERLRTFKGWAVHCIKPEDLARAGFFYLKERDKVQCVFCKGIVSEWEEGDVPITEHHRHFPSCRFIQGLRVGNIPIGSETSENCNHSPPPDNDVTGRYKYEMEMFSGPEKGHISIPNQSNSQNLTHLGITRHSGPKHPNFATDEARLRTFEDWPASIPQSPRSLVDAGFYYAGVSDHVRCFFCDGGLRNWEATDDPWVEHARWFGLCTFLILVKGKEFVDNAKAQHPPVISENITTNKSQPEVLTVNNEEIDSLMKSPVVQRVVECGVAIPVIKYTLRKKIQMTGVPFPNPDSLYEACIQNQAELNQSMINTKPNALQQPQQLPNGLVSRGGQCSKNIPTSVSAPNFRSLTEWPVKELEKKTDAMTLIEENQRLKEMQQCKICMEEEVGVVFLPCGHLITCPKCAPCITDCPLCRKPIEHTVRTYLS